MALPTGDKATSAVWVEKAGPAHFVVGQQVTYKIMVTNLTKLSLLDVEVTETLAEGFKVQYAKPKATLAGSDLKWKMDTLGPGASETLMITGTMEKAGTLTGCTTVTYRPPAVCLALKAVDVGLKVAKTGPEEVLLCDPITYTMTVTNTGDVTACNVVLKDTLPAGLKTTDGRQSVVMNLGDIEAGKSVKRSLSAKASEVGTFSNESTAEADGGIKAKSNMVSTKVVQSALSIAKMGPKMRYIDRPAEYTITVKNTSKVPATRVLLTDTLSGGTTFHGASDGGTLDRNKVIWQLGTLDAGAEKTVTLTVSSKRPGAITDVATVQAYCVEAKTAEGRTEIKGIPAVLLEVVDVADPIEVGAEETYEITVTNQGSADGTNIVVKATIPPEEELVSATGETKSSVQGKVVTFAPLAKLAAGAKARYFVKVKGVKAGDARFAVELKSDQITAAPVTETESTHVYE
jgi:uncharacterized repeat protein (TIGR01451 family)